MQIVFKSLKTLSKLKYKQYSQTQFKHSELLIETFKITAKNYFLIKLHDLRRKFTWKC